MLQRFFIYGFIGVCLEVLWTGMCSLFRGDLCLTARTYLWMIPIYGFAVLLEPLDDRIGFLPTVVRGCIWVVVIWTIEYLAGFVLFKTVGKCPWDYSESTRLTVSGFIRWDFAPLWFIVGLLFEKLHKLLDFRR